MTIYFGDGTSQAAAGLSGAGKVLQVVQTLKSDTASYTGWTETDISGMTCSITPASSSNKILVIVSACLASTGSASITLYRGTTKIGGGDTATNRTPVLSGGYAGGGSYGPMYFGAWVHSHTILDSPSTTSSTTYKLRWLAESGGNTKYLNRSVYDMSNNVNHQERTCSTITLMEVSG